MFNNAIKTEEQLGELRRRKGTGKNVEKYQREQNDVRHDSLQLTHGRVI